MKCRRHNVMVRVHTREDKMGYYASCDLCEAEHVDLQLKFDDEDKWGTESKEEIDFLKKLFDRRKNAGYTTNQLKQLTSSMKGTTMKNL